MGARLHRLLGQARLLRRRVPAARGVEPAGRRLRRLASDEQGDGVGGEVAVHAQVA